MNDDNKRILELLTGPGFASFCRDNSIALALLFGSRATGRAQNSSDFDLALLLEEYPKDILSRGKAKRTILHKLSTYVSSSRIDLVILNDASSFLVYNVTQNSKVLYEANLGEYARLCSLAIRQLSDGQMFREAEKIYLSKRV